MKYLLVTSDDFGMTLSINRGILDAMTRGIVGATNLMVPCPWFVDAAHGAKSHDLPVGIHLTLTCEWERYRWAPLTASSNLRAADGGMHRSYADLPDVLSESEIRAEFDAQLGQLRRQGSEPTHVDSHMMASASSSLMELRVKAVILRLCADEGLIYTYDTRADGSLIHFDTETHASPLSMKQLEVRLSSLGQGVHHVICHCALDSEEQRSLCEVGKLGWEWAGEYRVKDHHMCTSPELSRFLIDQGFTLLSMREFLALRHP